MQGKNLPLAPKIIFLVLATIFIFLLLIPFTYELAYQGKIYPGIRIGPFEIGNKKPEEAQQLLQETFDRQQKIKLIDPFSSRSWTIELEAIDFSLRPEEAIQKAYWQGRKGPINKQIKEKIQAWEGKTILPLDFTFNQEKLTAQIATIAAQVAVPAIPPQIEWQPEIKINPGQAGRELDQRRLQEMITRRLAHFQLSPLSLPIKTTNPPPSPEEIKAMEKRVRALIGKSLYLNLQDEQNSTIILKEKDLIPLLRFLPVEEEEAIKEKIKFLSLQIDRPPQDALFEFNNGRVTAFKPAKNGRKLDQEKAKVVLKNALDKLIQSPNSREEVDLPISIYPPQITNENVNNLGINTLLGEGVSFFVGSSPARKHNIQLAASRLHGILIPPEKVFSFNQSLGEVSQLTGYQKAYIIKNGQTVLGDGGGVCQVSTTLFRAALNAGLPIIERWPHAYRVSYYEQKSHPGTDATVFMPSPDLKFKNDTGHHILIQSAYSASENKLVFSLYGTSDGRQAHLTNFRLWDIVPPPPPKYIDDPTLPQGVVKQIEHGIAGAKAAFDWQVVKDGKIIHQQTFYSFYQPWQAVYLRGTRVN